MLWPTVVRILVDLLGRAPSAEETAALRVAWNATEDLPHQERHRERLKALLRFLADYVDTDPDPRAMVLEGVVDQSDNGVSTIEVAATLPEGTRVRVVLPPEVGG